MHAHFLPDQKVSIVRFPTVAVTEAHGFILRAPAHVLLLLWMIFALFLPVVYIRKVHRVCAKRIGSITVVGTVSHSLCDQIIY